MKKLALIPLLWLAAYAFSSAANTLLLSPAHTSSGLEQGMSASSGSGSGGAPEVITDLYSRNFTNPTYSLPTCTAGTGCEALCYASGTDWVCVDETGASIATTQGTGAISWASPWGNALDDVTDARAPRTTTAGSISVAGGAHTVVWAGYSSDVSFSYQYPVAGEATAGDNWQMRQEGFSFKFYAGLYEAVYPDPTGPLFGFGVFSGRSNSANTSWTVRANGLENTDSTGTWTDPTGVIWWFGRGIGGCVSGCSLRGPMNFTAFYSVEKTSDELLYQIERPFYGIAYDPNSPIDFSRGGTLFKIVNGRAIPLGAQTPYVSARGLEIDRGTQNNTANSSGWATTNLNASTWTVIGTPVATTQVSGPWDAYLHTSTSARLVEDDSAVVHEGYQGTLQCADDSTITGFYTASCWVRSGTTGTTTTQASIGIVTNGTGSTDCSYTNLTSSYSRIECTAEVTGSPTSIQGRIRVGDAAADTGSIIVAQCQCDAMAFPGGERVGADAVTFTEYTIPSTEESTWPTGETTGGEAEIVFTLDHAHPEEADFYEYLLDARNVDLTDHWLGVFLTYVNKVSAPRIRVALRPDNSVPTVGDQTDTDTYSDELPSLVPGQAYVVRFRYVPAGVSGGYERVNHFIYFDECANTSTCTATTLVGSDTTGTKFAAIAARGGGASLGQRLQDEIGLFHGAYHRVRVSQIE